MDRRNVAMMLTVPLVLAILLGSIEVFNLRYMLDSRKRVEEYQKEQEKAALEQSGVVKQLLMESILLERKMAMINESTWAEASELRRVLSSLLMAMSGSNTTVEIVEKDLQLDGCKKRSVNCRTLSQYNARLNITYSECLTDPRPTLDGEVVGETSSSTQLRLGRLVHRDCSMETPDGGISTLEAIPATGSSLVYKDSKWYCRCYGIANGNANLQSFICRLTETECGAGASFVQDERLRK